MELVPTKWNARQRENWKVLRLRVFRRDGYRCQECGKAGRLECDHKLPLVDGGGNDMENLQTLCRDCHYRKTTTEYRQRKIDRGEYSPEFAAALTEWEKLRNGMRHKLRQKVSKQ